MSSGGLAAHHKYHKKLRTNSNKNGEESVFFDAHIIILSTFKQAEERRLQRGDVLRTYLTQNA